MVVNAILAAALLGITTSESCPAAKYAGVNVLVHPTTERRYSHTEVEATALPILPAGTRHAVYGRVDSDCGFDGEIVIGGPLSISEGGRFYNP